MFRASLRPSSGGQTAFSMPVVFCPVKGNPYVVLCYGGRSWIVWSLCVCVFVYAFGVFIVGKWISGGKGQKIIGSENAVWPPDDGRKYARNMLRDNWLPIKSLIVASSWSHLYLLIKDARSFEYEVLFSSLLSKYLNIVKCRTTQFSKFSLPFWIFQLKYYVHSPSSSGSFYVPPISFSCTALRI